ncbi:uncharacterized protein J4E79_009686 [Alternaria viburni]|uniref:uncharacterized protein n=1 Tax=Alternaria viburni TaxID=566460 RepID=UPI0020C298BE|nr:uncharacterized protein J4E79_009686 [Alternaria viburni]KAI4649840.1 hypothetical protein J4E79_009686 [Alternaria viburni]
MSPTQSSSSSVVYHPRSVPGELSSQPQNQPGGYNPLSPDFFWDTAYTFPAPVAPTPPVTVIKATSQLATYRAQPAKGAVFGSARAPPPANPWGGNVFARIKADDEVVRERAKEESEREGGGFRPKMTQTWKAGGGKKVVVEVFEEKK